MTSVIHPSAKVEHRLTMGEGCVIGANVQLGTGCKLAELHRDPRQHGGGQRRAHRRLRLARQAAHEGRQLGDHQGAGAAAADRGRRLHRRHRRGAVPRRGRGRQGAHGRPVHRPGERHRRPRHHRGPRSDDRELLLGGPLLQARERELPVRLLHAGGPRLHRARRGHVQRQLRRPHAGALQALQGRHREEGRPHGTAA